MEYQLLGGGAGECQHPERAAHIWRFREKVELEAADVFSRFVDDLVALRANPQIVQLARSAAEDEKSHAVMCRRLVDRFCPGLAPLRPRFGAEFGPAGSTRKNRTLYTAVAVGCVTETLSTALLLRMRVRAQDDLVRTTVQRILRDEVSHSRIGWAYLAAVAATEDVSWLGPHLQGMLSEAVMTDIAPMGAARTGPVELSGYGILSRVEVEEIVDHTIETVIYPGLETHGIDTR